MRQGDDNHPILHRDPALLMQVATGREKADLVVLNTTLLNVYTGELLDHCTVATKDKWIAYVGDASDTLIGDLTTVIDGRGKTLIPGFIDGHTHLAWLFSVSECLPYIIPGGTTTIITETLEPYPVGGLAGVLDFVESFHQQPIKIFGTAPFMASTSQTARGILLQDLQQLLAREDIIGLGESYWQAVLQNPTDSLPALSETVRHRKTLEGHTAGARGNKLMAYVAAGISSCHEPITADEVIDRLRLGLYVMIREGSIRRDLEAIAQINSTPIDYRRLVLVTDGISPGDLLELGYMEYLVQKAINCGFTPVHAVQMATLNVAEHFGIDEYVGGIAPGKYADMLVIPDLNTISPEVVISNGTVCAVNGQLKTTPRKHKFDHRSYQSIHLTDTFNASDFVITAPVGPDRASIRAIEMVTDLVTKETRIDCPIINGELKSNAGLDLVKVAAIDRTHSPGKSFVGMIKGFHLQSGAIAGSAAWDTSDIIVVGASDNDMALAVNRITKLQGGAVVCNAGKVLAELPLPVFGLISEEPIEKINHQLIEIKAAARKLGNTFPDPLLSLIALTGAAIPFLRICEEGLFDFKSGATLGLFLEEKTV